VQEELAGAFRIVVLAISVGVRRDVRTEKVGLAMLEIHVAILQIRLPLAQ